MNILLHVVGHSSEIVVGNTTIIVINSNEIFNTNFTADIIIPFELYKNHPKSPCLSSH